VPQISRRILAERRRRQDGPTISRTDPVRSTGLGDVADADGG
jgi:hypothetical protein